MTSQEPSNPVVRKLVAAINDGDRDAFLATLTPDATLTDDGNPRSIVVILGVVAGRAWHERSPGTSQTSELPLPCDPQLPPPARVQGPADGLMPLPIQGRLSVPSTALPAVCGSGRIVTAFLMGTWHVQFALQVSTS
jgi:hypothetical protein